MHSDPCTHQGETKTSRLRVIQRFRLLAELRNLYFREPSDGVNFRELSAESLSHSA